MCCAVQMKSGSSVENARPENGNRQRRVAANNVRYGIHDADDALSGLRRLESPDRSGSPGVTVMSFFVLVG